ncbi:outer membrane beta-barrel family protein [Pinibacter soli]|uniref:Outer membrane beta-barrel family protein n=1 Tax=Pinibacter soli TaxID=3044211 RepID=A0ABT6RJZ6_9BACT|nr:outer membrane beta-barrel family protein [Pinibacter soli]MDI3322172.1 outer membrane beta-barrel family protein [Pinibacter soli]
MATLLFVAINFFVSSQSFCQTINGTVVDSVNKPLGHANVLLLKAKDSSLVKAIMCDDKGIYSFANISEGKYLIVSNFVNHKAAYSSSFILDKARSKISLPPIILIEQTTTLKEVTVSVKKPLLEQKIDRLVINVANSITAAGNTALEVLERSPGVIVDHQNNAIAMNGKSGVVLMINGKISRAPVSAVMQLLESMPSGNIEKIELITTPPANLDAEGNAGYINIVLKENNNEGTNGSVSGTIGYGKGPVTQVAANINHRKGNINLYGDISYSRIHKPLPIDAYNIVSNNGDITKTTFTTDRMETRPNLNCRVGMDVELSKKTVLGVLFSGYDNKYSQTEHNTSTITKNDKLDTTIQHYNNEINHWHSLSGNVNLQHSFNETDKIVFNADYMYYGNHQPVNYHSVYFDGNNNYAYEEYFRNEKTTPISFWIFALDYSKKIGKHVSLNAGLKETISTFDNDISFEQLIQNEWIKDDSLSAKYTLKENYSAAYASVNATLGKRTEAKLGLRYEYTNSNLGTVEQKDIVDRHYGNLFPSFFITHKLNDNNSLDFSYSRRITRPTFNDLAPFTYYANANTLITGNPALQPAISNNYKVGYTFKSYLLSVSYSKETNSIAGFQPKSDSTTNKLLLSAQNLNNVKTVSVILSLPFNVTKWWVMQLNLTGLWQQINATYKGDPVSADQINYNINASERFTLPKNFSLEISGYYQSKFLGGIYTIHGRGSLDVGVRKKLQGKGGAFTLNAVNILNTSYLNAEVNMPEQNLITGVKIYFSQPTIKLTYTRNFGKEKLKAKRNYATGAEEEKGRVE